MQTTPNPAVLLAYEHHPPAMRARLWALRALVLAVAEAHPDIGRIEEAVKWGQPSFLTRPKTGTTVRLGAADATTSAVYVHCQSKVVERARVTGLDLGFDGTRAVRLPLDQPVPAAAVRTFVELALTYHQWKRRWPG
jgi:uncharacterized protein YdhG (YjbR/CyaY superfamily)